MMRLFFFFVGLCWVVAAHAQKLTVTYSESNPEITKGDPIILYNEADNNLLHGGEVRGNRKDDKLDYWMNQYDPNSLKKTNSNTISLEYSEYKEVIASFGDMNIFIHKTRTRNKETKKLMKSYSATILSEQGSLVKNVPLCSFDNDRDGENSSEFKFVVADDLSGLAGYRFLQVEAKNNISSFIEWIRFDKNCKKISEGKIQLKYNPKLPKLAYVEGRKSIEFINARLDVSGNLYLLNLIHGINLDDLITRKSIPANVKTSNSSVFLKKVSSFNAIISISINKNEYKEHFLLSDKFYFMKTAISKDTAGNLLILATTSGDNPENSGIYYSKLEPQTLKVLEERLNPYSKNIVRYSDTYEKGGMNLPILMDIDYLILAEDGINYLFVQGIKTESKTSSQNNRDRTTISYQPSDLFVFAFSSSGELLWNSRIGYKSNISIGGDAGIGRNDRTLKVFLPFISEKTPYILFYDHPDNLNKTDYVGLKEGDLLDTKKSHLVMVSFDAQGKWKKQDVMPAFSKEKGYPLIYEMKHMGNSAAVAVTKGSKSGEAYLVKMNVVK